jgi:hypothetical protein
MPSAYSFVRNSSAQQNCLPERGPQTRPSARLGASLTLLDLFYHGESVRARKARSESLSRERGSFCRVADDDTHLQQWNLR